MIHCGLDTGRRLIDHRRWCCRSFWSSSPEAQRKETVRHNSDLSASLVEMLAGLEELQAFGTSDKVLEKIN